MAKKKAANLTAGALRQMIERVERLDAEIKALQADKAAVFAEAKAVGFDTKIMRAMVRERKMNQADRQEWLALLGLPTFSLIDFIHDPCCGSGNVVKASRASGRRAKGSDLEDRSAYVSFVTNFLNLTRGAVGAGRAGAQLAIVSNPPYGGGDMAEAFIRHFVPMRTAEVVAVFVQSRFLHSGKRHKLYAVDHQPSIVAHLSDRPSCPPGEALLAGEIEAKGGSQDYCWLIYDKRGLDVSTRTVWLRNPTAKIDKKINNKFEQVAK